MRARLTLKCRGYSCFVQYSELSERGFVVNDTLSFSVDLRVTRHVEWSAYVPPPPCIKCFIQSKGVLN